MCGYYCNRSVRGRPEDFDSYKFVQALKGKPLNMHAFIPVRGRKERLSNDNADDAIKWFAMMSCDYLGEKDQAGPFLVIPVPNSKCAKDSTVRPRTRKLAKAVCDLLDDGSVIVDCLRWKENLGSAAEEGGPREAEILFENLVLLRGALDEADEDWPVLLIDDVTTSGGHLRACSAKLKVRGLNVALAICGAKTVYDQKIRAFHVYEYELEHYKPPK